MLDWLLKSPLIQPLRMKWQQWFDNRMGDPKASVELNARNVYVIPTRYGFILGAMLFVLLLGAMNYSNSMSFMMTFLIVGIALIAMHATFGNLSRLRIKSQNNPAVFAKNSAKIHLSLSPLNKKTRYGVFLDDVARSSDAFECDGQTPTGSVGYYHTPTLERGVYHCPKVRIWTTYPLGLFFSWSWLRLDSRVLIYPEPKSFLPLNQQSGDDSGSRSHTQRGDDEFSGIRKYLDTDSPKRIAWKAVAHSQQLLSKEFTATTDHHVWLNYNALHSLPLESRLSQLCYWILECEQNEQAYGLKLPDFNSGIDLGDAHKIRCLEQLALFQPNVNKEAT